MKFRAEIEFDIEDAGGYIKQAFRSQAHLNELVKFQIEDDLADALLQYGMAAQVVGVRKVSNREAN